MTAVRGAVIVIAVSLCSAGLVAFVSRTPPEVRQDRPGPRATDPARGAYFTPEEIRRHAAYRGPSYLAFALGIVVQATALVALARGGMGWVVAGLDRVPGGWPVRAALAAVAVVVFMGLVALPLSFVRGYVVERAWGLSTQSALEWLSDVGRSLLVGAVTASAAAAAFFGVVRWQPRTWWWWGWVAFTALSALLVFVYPLVVAPLFNEFTPLQDRSLRARIEALADRAAVRIDDVLVADASRRTTAENAYVAGIGSSKRLVVYDTLLESGSEEETALVVAHELGHRAENHIAKTLVVTSAGLLVGFALLAWLAGRDEVWEWAGASGIGDLRAIPMLLLFSLVTGLAALPIQNGISRAFERRADAIAVELTGDEATAVRVFRRLAYSNLADLDPPEPAVWALFSHPPIRDRIRAVLSPRRLGQAAE